MQRNIKLLAILNFLCDLRFYNAVLILYFAKVTGSYFLGMSIFSITMLSSAILEVPTGIFSDRLGRKNTTILGAVASFSALVLYALGGNYAMLCAGAILEGLSRAFYSGNNDALLHDSLVASGKKEQFAEYLGKTQSFFQLALMIAVGVGGVIASISYQYVMWLSVIPQFISIIVALFIISPPRITRESGNIFSHFSQAYKLIINNRKLKLLTIYQSLQDGIGESVFQFYSVFVSSLWPLWAVGFSKAFAHLNAMISYWFSGRTIKKLGSKKVLLIANLYTRVADFIGLLFPSVVSPVLLSSTSIFHGTKTVAINDLMHQEFSSEQRATQASLTSLFGSIIFAIASLLIGLLADKLGSAMTIIVAEVVLLVSIIIPILIFKKEK